MFKKIIFFIILIQSCIIYAEENFEYRISITNNLNLREEPNINSKTVMVNRAGGKEKKQLHITEPVKVLKIDEKEVIVNGNKGRWILVDTRSYDLITKKQITGWVFDYYLAKKNDFKPLDSLPNNLELVFDFGDAIIHYKFFNDGTAQFIDEDGVFKGKLYIDNRNKVVIAKWDKHKELFLWSDSFIYKDGNLCVFSIELDKTCSKVMK